MAVHVCDRIAFLRVLEPGRSSGVAILFHGYAVVEQIGLSDLIADLLVAGRVRRAELLQDVNGGRIAAGALLVQTGLQAGKPTALAHGELAVAGQIVDHAAEIVVAEIGVRSGGVGGDGLIVAVQRGGRIGLVRRLGQNEVVIGGALLLGGEVAPHRGTGKEQGQNDRGQEERELALLLFAVAVVNLLVVLQSVHQLCGGLIAVIRVALRAFEDDPLQAA